MLGENTLVQNRYLIRNLIGRGGMGAVYLAIDTHLNNSFVALKEMIYTDNPKLEAAFKREADLLNKLQHPLLPKVSNFFHDRGFQYLAMEYIPGDDLGIILRKNNAPFPIRRVLHWADSLLEILEYLHLQTPPVIHRDIKPQNLKLNVQDQIILLDFGLAKDTLTHISRLTNSDSLIGFTPNYAPLEQIRGDRSTVQTDLYSVAATIYHLLTNVAPVSSLTRVQAKIDDLPDPLLPAYQINPEIPFPLSEILMEGLALKSENRPVSATEMRRRFREVFNQIGLAEEPRRLQEIPSETQAVISQENDVKTIAFTPVAGMGARPLADFNASNSSFPLPKKSENRSSILLFGALFGLLAIGIAATFFIGQWISSSLNPSAELKETNSNVNISNAEESNIQINKSSGATVEISNSKNSNVAVTNVNKPSIINKPVNIVRPVNKPAANTRIIPQPTQERVVTATPTKPQPTRTPGGIKNGSQDILQ